MIDSFQWSVCIRCVCISILSQSAEEKVKFNGKQIDRCCSMEVNGDYLTMAEQLNIGVQFFCYFLMCTNYCWCFWSVVSFECWCNAVPFRNIDLQLIYSGKRKKQLNHFFFLIVTVFGRGECFVFGMEETYICSGHSQHINKICVRI